MNDENRHKSRFFYFSRNRCYPTRPFMLSSIPYFLTTGISGFPETVTNELK